MGLSIKFLQDLQQHTIDQSLSYDFVQRLLTELPSMIALKKNKQEQT